MKVKKTRKRPVTAPVKSQSTTHRATQATISSFHTLLKRKAQLAKSGRDENKEEIDRIDQEIESLGGLESYQTASKHGQSIERGGDSAKVLIGWLKELGVKGKGKEKESCPLRLLEIGALKPDNYAECSSWIQNTPIDLRTEHPDILEQDFFDRPVSETDQFDLISCSLVLNFVPEPSQRGRMLQLIHAHLRPSTTSLLFLVLPLPCVTNSRYLTPEHLEGLMAEVGFKLVRKRWKEGGKVAYWLWSRSDTKAEASGVYSKKKVITDGPRRNNFAIIL